MIRHHQFKTSFYRREKTYQILSVVAVFIFIVGGIEIYTRISAIPAYILPPPSLVLNELKKLLLSSLFWDNLFVTMKEVVFGFLFAIVLAVVFGVAIAQIKVFQLAFMPYIIAFQTIPTVALAPILLQWFGYGLTSKVIMAALISFFPMLVNIVAGLQSARQQDIQMMKAFGATQIQILMKVKFPASLPFVFTGVGLGIIFALIGAIVAEFIGAQKGLGTMMLQLIESFNIAGMFAVLMVLSLIGVCLHLLVEYAKAKIVFWKE
ncbi:ABC transporter permease [Bartonella tamiae]|uniref:ABC transmembrane type-1 domain-containing protein n=1 Tax=Bartonella tamiae Th239 TaxID=1094558 RepID=J0ZQV5_9HYPH|nr:ABC transporter permease [Bartonella tamiae]EJF91058.1 hypothetical protein ME5_00390 [Bartonella tamiae Th239]EJF93277.1 hypothetical protein MEG_01491 [Bartonella tamiae Th307]